MKFLKQLLFIAIISVCASLTAFAQRDDPDKKTPPKDKPPVVVVKPKDPEKPKDDKSKDGDNKPKKPQASMDRALNLVQLIFD